MKNGLHLIKIGKLIRCGLEFNTLKWNCAIILGKLWSVLGETQMVSSNIVPVKKSQAINTYRCMKLKE